MIQQEKSTDLQDLVSGRLIGSAQMFAQPEFYS